MKRIISSLAVGIIILLSFMPLAGQFLGAGPNIDNRQLNSVPKWEGSLGNWFSNFDDYLNDNFGFRSEWVRINRGVRDALKEDPPKVTKGKDGWLFLSNPDYRKEFEGRGDWTDERVENWINALGALKQVADDRQIPFAAMIAVDKSQMFPEKLPNNWVGPSSRRFRNALYEHPKAKEIGLIDPEPVLRKAKEEGIQIYQTRDTHWNRNGGYLATEMIWDRIDPNGERDRFRFDGNYKDAPSTMLRDLERMAGYSETAEPTVLMVPFPNLPGYKSEKLPPLTEEAMARRFGQPAIKITSTAPAPKGTLLIVGDSFTNIPTRYLKTGYEDVIRIHRRNGEIPLSEIKLYDADAIVFINSERHAGWLDAPFQVKP